MDRWWKLSAEEAAKSFGTHIAEGLSSQEAAARLEKFGPNRLKEKRASSPITIFLEQFRNFIVWVLIGAALVSGFLKELIDALAIILIVIVNAILGFIQEYRAEKSLAALKKMSSPSSKVTRNGKRLVIPSSELVPGDLIELESGDSIPADCRITWLTSNFSAEEASLTGESTPVLKTAIKLDEEDVPLADRANMLYMGTSVALGKARGIIVETGMLTELGKIAGMIQNIEEDTTPLQKKLEEFGKWIVYLCIALVGLVFVLGIARGGKALDMFLTSVSLAVAAIPEGLPAVVTIALALGVQRMVKRHALIRKLPSVETLGCATVICSDKTGTLTKNEMTVQAVFSEGKIFDVTGIGYGPTGEFHLNGLPVDLKEHPGLQRAMLCGILCNGAQLSRSDEASSYGIVGDPTEGAILTAAAKIGLLKEAEEEKNPFLDELPFDSERKKMTIVRKSKNRIMAYVKGAPDVLLNDCKFVYDGISEKPLTDQDRENILRANSELTGRAMRVLAVAYRDVAAQGEAYDISSVESKLTFTGLVAMIDPPREEVKKAIEECKSAGIKTVMITGDHKNTAIAIARSLGFFREGSIAMTGEELDKITDEALADRIEAIPVYARVSPEHKLKIVRAWRSKGEVVAMTGDGVNDAPAVKEADIGVAMGITGTDVTKEVSDMVVTDDNFASIVAAVEEGRGIYDNIKKFIHYLLSCNAGEILVMFIATLAGFPLPLLPIHILWVNLVTDGLPALALGVDPVDKDIMKRPPRPTNENIITGKRAVLMLVQGSFIAFCSLLAFTMVLFVENEGIARARTAAFIVLSCSQLFHSFNCRNMTESIFKIGIFTNIKLIAANSISFALQILVVYQPFLQKVFKTENLGLFDWIMVISISSFPLWAMEIVKLANKKFKFINF